MNQNDKAKQFARLHVPGTPLVLYNAWDAGSAKSIQASGAKAIATSSWSVAAAQGFRDGEAIPLAFVEQIVSRIAGTVDLPVTVDFEGGYSDDDAVLAENIERLLEQGIIGINFEDRIVRGKGLYSAERQSQRIRTIRAAATRKGIDLFINARSDVFFAGANDLSKAVDDALKRAKVYADAGASGLFIPGLTDESLISQLSKGTELPVNVMVMEGLPGLSRLAEIGVARVSYGPIPYIDAMKSLTNEARGALSGQNE
jgi:2-methylisocitrate lyase-like PEP mutase family enzyme